MTIKLHISLSSHLLCEGIKKLVCEGTSDVIFEAQFDPHSTFEPDIVLFDSKNNIRDLIEQHPNAKFVLIDTGLKELDLTCLLLCHHISGVISQRDDHKALYKALKVVHDGDIWLDQKHLKTMIKTGHSLPDGDGIKGLSAKDKEIVRLISLGCKNNEIAETLCLSESTIKAHVSKIFKWLKVKNRAQLACLAKDNDVRGF